MTTKTIARPGVRAPTAPANGRGKRVHLSRAKLDAMHKIYPENTETMPDALQQQPFMLYLIMALQLHFDAVGRTAAVVGDVFIFYREGDTQAKFAADMSVTMGVSFEDLNHDRNYYSWLIGALPSLVLESGSRNTARNDLRRKFRLYARLGILEYWLLDVPIGEYYGFLFRGYRLVDGEYVEIEPEPDSPAGMVHYRSRVMDLDFCIPEGATRLDDGDLRVYDPESGEYLQTAREMNADLISQRSRANLERDLRLEAEYREAAERERAETAESRIKELEELLRDQGLD